MQCKPVTALPAGEKWTFEIKFDGYRCIAAKRSLKGRLVLPPQERCSTNALPRIVEAIPSLYGDFVLDGG